MNTALLDLDSVIDDHTGHARTVLDYTAEMKRTIDRAKEPGFDATAWEPLARFVATDTFTRVGPFKDTMDWPAYVTFLTGWAPRRHWECSLRRITETGNLVFLELEERSDPHDRTAAANSLSVYEFDDRGRISHLGVHLQITPASGMPGRAGGAD